MNKKGNFTAGRAQLQKYSAFVSGGFEFVKLCGLKFDCELLEEKPKFEFEFELELEE